MDPFLSAHDGIDVDQIMANIRRRIEERRAAGVLKESELADIEEMELQPLPDFLEIPNVYQPHLYPEGALEKFMPQAEKIEETGLVKGIMKQVRRLLFPLVRFMTRPIVTDLRNAIVDLQRQTPVVVQSKEYIKLLHNTISNVIVEMTKLKIEEETLKTKIKILEDKMEFLENRERAIEKKIAAP